LKVGVCDFNVFCESGFESGSLSMSWLLIMALRL